MSELLALGICHKTAPVALRERLAFASREAIRFAELAAATAEVREAVVISTCNRTEVYLVVGDRCSAEADVLGPAGAPSRDPPDQSWPRRSTRHVQLRRRPPASTA